MVRVGVWVRVRDRVIDGCSVRVILGLGVGLEMGVGLGLGLGSGLGLQLGLVLGVGSNCRHHVRGCVAIMTTTVFTMLRPWMSCQS